MANLGHRRVHVPLIELDQQCIHVVSAGTSVYRCNDVVALASTDAHESHAPGRRVVETPPDEYLHLQQPGTQRIGLIVVTTMPLNPVSMLHFANRNC